MIRLALIGPGRVGRTLARLLPKDKVRLGAVISRNLTSARRAVRVMKRGSAVKTLRRLNEADVVLIAVPEPEIPGVVERLEEAKVDYEGKVILHTSAIREARCWRRSKNVGLMSDHCNHSTYFRLLFLHWRESTSSMKDHASAPL